MFSEDGVGGCLCVDLVMKALGFGLQVLLSAVRTPWTKHTLNLLCRPSVCVYRYHQTFREAHKALLGEGQNTFLHSLTLFFPPLSGKLIDP